MTVERILTLDFGDIRAIRVVCAKCKATVSMRLDETVRLPRNCPNCNEEWFSNFHPANGRDAQAIADAVKAASNFARRADLAFSLRLEMDDPSQVPK